MVVGYFPNKGLFFIDIVFLFEIIINYAILFCNKWGMANDWLSCAEQLNRMRLLLQVLLRLELVSLTTLFLWYTLVQQRW